VQFNDRSSVARVRLATVTLFRWFAVFHSGIAPSLGFLGASIILTPANGLMQHPVAAACFGIIPPWKWGEIDESSRRFKMKAVRAQASPGSSRIQTCPK